MQALSQLSYNPTEDSDIKTAVKRFQDFLGAPFLEYSSLSLCSLMMP